MLYRAATQEDIDLLVFMRMIFLEIEENNPEYEMIKENCYTYFRDAFAKDACDVILAEEKGKCIGTGIVFYYDSVPSAFNVTGKNAYITSMYVEPEYRGNGVGTDIVKEIIKLVKKRNYTVIMLNASDMGKPMYVKLGFQEIHNGMLLHIGGSVQ